MQLKERDNATAFINHYYHQCSSPPFDRQGSPRWFFRLPFLSISRVLRYSDYRHVFLHYVDKGPLRSSSSPFFFLFLLFSLPSNSTLSILLPMLAYSSFITLVCRLHLNLASHALSANFLAWFVSLIWLFLSILVTLRENLNIFNCVTTTSPSCFFDKVSI